MPIFPSESQIRDSWETTADNGKSFDSFEAGYREGFNAGHKNAMEESDAYGGW